MGRLWHLGVGFAAPLVTCSVAQEIKVFLLFEFKPAVRIIGSENRVRDD